MDSLINEVQRLANENRNKFYTIMRNNHKEYIICDRDQTVQKAKEGWHITYGFERQIKVGEGTPIILHSSAFDLIETQGWYGKDDIEKMKAEEENPPPKKRGRKPQQFHFGGWVYKGFWYHPDNPPAECVLHAQKVLAEFFANKVLHDPEFLNRIREDPAPKQPNRIINYQEAYDHNGTIVKKLLKPRILYLPGLKERKP